MAKIIWTKKLTEQFIELGSLNEFEQYILRSRIAGKTVIQQSMEANCSVSTVNRCIARIKLVYDYVQAENPDIFPIRRQCDKEVYMDTH